MSAMKDRLPYDIVDGVVARFAELRAARNLSYEELSRRTGLHRTAISLIERNERSPTLLSCIKIASALDIKLEDLIIQARRQAAEKTGE